MTRYKDVYYDQDKFIPISFQKQILPGTFEYTLRYLIDTVKVNKIIPITILLSMLPGCGGSGSNDTQSTSPLIGVWVTETCKQASDSNGVPLNVWGKGLYEFTNQGTIRLGNEQYLDSNCAVRGTPQALTDTTISITYKDNGSQLLQEGINGAALLIEIGTGNQVSSVDAFYTINNNSLCFSDAFTFEAFTFGVSELGASSIDFSNCLIRP